MNKVGSESRSYRIKPSDYGFQIYKTGTDTWIKIKGITPYKIKKFKQ